MLRGLWRLTWLETRIFIREPLGFVGTVLVPVLLFMFLGSLIGPGIRRGSASMPAAISVDLPILTSMFVVVSAMLSLITIVAIYREGGILKRLRATPLRPQTILTAHVMVKLIFTAATILLMLLAGRRYFPIPSYVPIGSFVLAVLFGTVCVMSLGFLLASVVPTARFAQPIGALVLYPMLAISGLFVPVAALPPAVRALARLLPFTYAVSLLRGIWRGEGWPAHAGDILALAAIFLACTAVSSRVFRWE